MASLLIGMLKCWQLCDFTRYDFIMQRDKLIYSNKLLFIHDHVPVNNFGKSIIWKSLTSFPIGKELCTDFNPKIHIRTIYAYLIIWIMQSCPYLGFCDLIHTLYVLYIYINIYLKGQYRHGQSRLTTGHGINVLFYTNSVIENNTAFVRAGLDNRVQ